MESRNFEQQFLARRSTSRGIIETGETLKTGPYVRKIHVSRLYFRKRNSSVIGLMLENIVSKQGLMARKL